MMKWLVAYYQGSTFRGMVHSVNLQFERYEDADQVAQRYNMAYPYHNGHYAPCLHTTNLGASRK